MGSEVGREEVVGAVREAAESVLPDYDVVCAYLFGSFARGDFSEGSDVDVAVYFEDYDLRKLLEVGRRLQEESGLGREVDVRALNEGSPGFRFRVVQEGIVVYAISPSRRADVEERIVHLYHDLRPHLRERWEERREALAGG